MAVLIKITKAVRDGDSIILDLTLRDDSAIAETQFVLTQTDKEGMSIPLRETLNEMINQGKIVIQEAG